MNTLTTWRPFQTTGWNPFRELADFERGLERFFGRTGTTGEEPVSTGMWEPPTDIIEDDKEFLVKLEVPEVKKEEIKVTVDHGTLRITGERKEEKEEKDKKHHRVERYYGSFLRAFALPDTADGSKITAECKDGVLKVHLPKTEAAKPHAVEIKIA
jgi:HSP20 family protein